MPSRPRSRKSSRSSTRNSFKSASILENGGQAPLQDEPNAVVQDDIELVPRNSQSIPDTGASAPAAPSGGVPPTSTTDDHMASRDEPTSTGTRIDPTASGQRERLPHKRFGLHTDQLRGQRPQGGLPMDYKQKYPEDPIYKETEENARVFHVYNDESQIFDDDMVIEAGDNLDILLVFAGLFASVLTTFVVQTSQSLSPDKTNVSNSLLREMISLQRAAENGTSFSSIPAAHTTFTISRTDIWVNSLWFISLALSLSTALLAVIAKQWLRQYSSFIFGTARERALIRQFRYDGFEKWGVRLIIGLLPMILHMSLFLFLSGLVVFLIPLNNTLARVVAGIAGFLCGAYTVTNILPLIFIECPYRTPLSQILIPFYGAARITFMALWYSSLLLLAHTKVVHRGAILQNPAWLPFSVREHQWKGFTYLWPRSLKEVERVRANETDKWGRPVGIASALVWLAQTTSDISAKAVIAEAVGSVFHSLFKTPGRDLTSVHWVVIEHRIRTYIFPRLRVGALLVAVEDERAVERSQRGAFMTNLETKSVEPFHCKAYSTMLASAVSIRPSILHMENRERQELLPHQVFSFVAEQDDLSVDLEGPSWIWWSLFTQAADSTASGMVHWLKIEKIINDIFLDGESPDIDSHREKWLKKVKIPFRLRHIVWQRMLDVYRDTEEYRTDTTKPYTLSQFSELFSPQFKSTPPSPFSIVSLATFLFEHFKQFTDFWMEAGDVHSHIESSTITDTLL